MKKTLLLLAVGVLCTSLFAQKDSIRETRIYDSQKVISNSLRIDGILDEEAWQSADWQGDFIQHNPYSGRNASFETQYAVCFDEDFIYIAFKAYDPNPDSIVSRLTRRDDLDGDLLFVTIDSYHDLRTAFEFVVNPAGVISDLIITDDGESMDETWDPIWWVKTAVTDIGWIAEVKIPFSQLRFDNSGDGVWGFNVGRIIYRKNEISFWQHIPADAPGIVHLFGKLHGLKDINPRKQAEVIPYATAGIKKYVADDENPFQPGLDKLLNAGVDAKIGVTNNLTLDVSVNPDFGQVEADPSEVNLTAYESFFEEKRPLFVEGKNIYNFPLRFGDGGIGEENLFYSRRIGRRPHFYPDLEDGEYTKQPEQTTILAAAKLSGKTRKGTSIGLLETVSRNEFAEIDLNGERRDIAVEPFTNHFVGRVVQDINEGNTIAGGMITNTFRNITTEELKFLPTMATSGGIDVQQYWGNKGYNVKLVNYFSHVSGSEEAITRLQESPARLYQRPDAEYLTLDTSKTSLSGYGGNLQFWKTSGKLNLLAAITWKSPGLELNDIGYLRQSDDLFQLFWVGYNFYEPFSIFRTLRINMDQFNMWDFGGNRAVSGMEVGSFAVFTNLWRANLHINVLGNKRINSFLRGGPAMLLPGEFMFMGQFTTDERKKLILEPGLRFGKGFENSSSSYNYSVELDYRPINSLNISLEPEYSIENNTLQYVSCEETADDERYIFASIEQSVLALSMRVNLTLSPNLTFQFWGQPFIATGSYSDFKHISDSKAANFSDRYYLYKENEIRYDELEEAYFIEEEGGAQYFFDNPAFNVKEFLTNLVVRWEYQPGSVFYVVWSQSRDQYDGYGTFNFTHDLADMVRIKPTNVLLIKFSYRIGR
ncbi:DUF5916 domain-containing protein [Bacteroidota bacterium]